ncbi:MAG TPA: hypothetical protein VFB00_10930 [Terriglobales bacterium]|nr:hypothetical protein [Terriglobales bacterium]
MRRIARLFTVLLVLAVVLPALADDQQKAVKQMRLMTAMARDATARAIISRAFSDTFKVARPQLVAERKFLGLSYGNFLLARQMMLSGSTLQQIADQLRAGRTILQIAGDARVDWKRIASEAKKMNNRIHDRIYDHFLHDGPDKERDRAEQYDPANDVVSDDADTTPEEILKAANEYVFWRNLAAPKSASQADGNSVVGHSYTKARDDIAATHGTTSPGAPGNR